jgi:hypothetical protein
MRALIWRRGAALFALGSLCVSGLPVETARATETIVEGRAIIDQDGLAVAREVATRRALARAVESHSARAGAQSRTQAEMAEAARGNANACARDVQPLGERIDGDALTVTLRVRIDACDVPQAPDNAACEKAYINRLVVTGFAFGLPGQLVEEWDGRLLPRRGWQGIESLTAVELARALERGGHVLAVFDDGAFPFASPARAPTPRLSADSPGAPFTALARTHQAQYVLSGVYRAFDLTRQERRIEIEAFVHDGANGAVLARRRFQTVVSGSDGLGATIFPNRPAIGARAFRETPFGRAWTELIGEIARWAEGQASCFPFIARVMKVEGRTLQIDAGAESRMNPGDTLALHLLRPPPAPDLSGRLPGQEKPVRAIVLLRAVYPAFSIAELIGAPDGLRVNPGDLVRER